MKIKTLVKMVRSHQLPLMLRLPKELGVPAYRASFLAAAASCGVLRHLAQQPLDAPALADELGMHGEEQLLGAWLDMGVHVGDLGRRGDRYRLRSRLAKALARPDADSYVALIEQLVRYHTPLLLDAPAMLREGRRVAITDQDGALIARSSRVLEPAVQGVVERCVNRTAPVRLLEVGCGSGTYVRHAASLNPRLTAVAIDLQSEVVEQASANLDAWGLAERVEVVRSDLRTFSTEQKFDLVTLHNNIYYFPQGERTKVLERVRSFLSPGGKLLLTTSCHGGSPGMEMLNLWCRYADFTGPLPRPDELVEQLREAGFTDVRSRRLMPGQEFRAFTGVSPYGVEG
ncbi:methyltransferase domain-containing protein [Streptomyces zagrosensis]|uniref:SAM-dependent methyltransferase n=1 Tax=Streptomyces zagrosensis TaxID=1042984 RepID=A0A7W9QD68_9ACTN|nr:methyltransferase domain-containing protein [Streptomyces zagrosensis]MBB5937032.1 SAM-dependent methyltransferase [Streptomyces zagrosensis]